MSQHLVTAFLEHVPLSVRSEWSGFPSLAERLAGLVTGAQAAWPQVGLTPEQFIPFLARHLPQEDAPQATLQTLRMHELYLVCAVALGVTAACRIVDAQYMPKVRDSLRRLQTPEALIADIEQELYRLLIEMKDPSTTRRGYSGRRELVGWLCLSAIRKAGLRRAHLQREQPLLPAVLQSLQGSSGSPFSELMIRRYKDGMQQAIAEAISSLKRRERNLLRFHFIARLSIDEIAAHYKIHRVTASRWIIRARERLAAQTRQLFLARFPMEPESFPELGILLKSQLSFSRGSMLVEATEPEAGPE